MIVADRKPFDEIKEKVKDYKKLLILGCGNCLLADYGGICPITMCAKSLVNGPCGGYKDGKCETSSDRNCAWIMIYERLAKQGKLDKMREMFIFKDYSVQSHPARQVNEAYTKAEMTEAKS